jgi:hypothetical protein
LWINENGMDTKLVISGISASQPAFGHDPSTLAHADYLFL